VDFRRPGAKSAGVWFFKKKPLQALCVEMFDVVATCPLDSYKTLAAQAYGCEPEQVETAVSRHWANLEMGKLKPEDFWDKVGADLTEMGVSHKVPGWKFKGIWDGIVEDNIKLNSEMISTIRQVRAAKFRTVASSNMIAEVVSAFQKAGAFEPFNLAVISSQITARKPHAQVFTRMSKLARTRPSQCLYLDKEGPNLEAAKAAGYRVMAYTGNPQETRWELLQQGLG
jgi:HAD superfamily hydrolase (TIGR01509 family)